MVISRFPGYCWIIAQTWMLKTLTQRAHSREEDRLGEED